MNKTFVVSLLIGASIDALIHGHFAMMAMFLFNALLCGAITKTKE